MSSQINPTRAIQDILTRHESAGRLTRDDTKLLVEAVLDETISQDTFANWLESTVERCPTS